MSEAGTILVVDDIASNRETLRELLEPEAYNLIEAADGPAALRLAATAPPDLVLLDVMMPGMDGYEVCRRLRADSRLAEMPVIMVTALDDHKSRLAAIEAGADDFITKPFNRVELRARVRTVTRLNRYRRFAEMQASLRESESRFLKLAENSDEVFWFTAAHPPRITFLSPAVGKVWGRPAAQFYADVQLWSRTVHPDDLPRVQAAYEGMLAGRVPRFYEEYRVIRPDGSVRWLLDSGTLIRGDDGAVATVGGVARDITERKAAEGLIREQNEILTNSREGVLVANLANEISLWNRGAEEIFGWTAAEALGRPSEQMLGLPDVTLLPALRAALEHDGYWRGELRAQARDGRKLIVECSTTLVRDEAGRPRARLSFLSNITEKKLLEEKFLRAQRLESIGTLAAGIAHDLNNVLAPILFAGQMLRSSLTTPADLKVLDVLELSARRGAALVKQILGVAHAGTGEFRPTQVKHLLRDITDVIEGTFPKNIELQHKVAADLWLVLGDPTQIHQVLLNLSVNARDAMPHGGALSIVAANRRLDAAEASKIPGATPNAWVVFEVTDTGTGISADVLNHIWEPFFTTKGAGKGTGLGLATIRGIVASHHGFVDVHTEVGRGTTFRVFLPAVEGEAREFRSATPFDAPDGHGELILLVDDEAPIRDFVSTILEQHGYRVVACGDGAVAINLVQVYKERFALVITDVAMPHIGGLGLVYALLQIRPGIRLIAMSGLSKDEAGGADLTEIQKFAHAFLAKPFTQNDLLGNVHRVLHPTKSP